MTEATAEPTTTLTEVLVRHAFYIHYGITRIAIDDFTLQDIAGDNTVQVAPSEARLLEEPGSPAWVERMVRIRNSLTGTVTNLRNENGVLTHWQQGIGEALLEEADRREWCSEYDDFAEEWDLPKRSRDFEVTITLTVTARSEDAAEEFAREHLGITSYTDNVTSGPEFEASEA